MDNDQGEIPLVGRLGTGADGLHLVASRPPDEPDRRIENWIACNLDLPSEIQAPNRWERIVGKLPGLRLARGKAEGRGGEERQVRSSGGWSRFQVAYRRGITVVRLVDQALVQRSHIRELGDDLTDLIAVGNHRIVLNFAAVERLGSWIVGVVGRAHRQCAAAEGGKLKVCGLEPHLADIFAIVGMAGEIELHPGEAEAIESPWPSVSSHRPLPVDILSALTSTGEIPPLRGGSPDSREGAAAAARPFTAHLHVYEPPVEPSRSPARREPRPPGEGNDRSYGRVWLHLQAGPDASREVAVRGARFVIGRERGCQLRIGSAHVSKQHAAIERRLGQVFLTDLSSTNGTVVNGHLIRGQEVEIRDGDCIQFGPAAATVSIAPDRQGPETFEEHPREWVHEEAAPAGPHGSETPSTAEMPYSDVPDPEGRIRHEVIQDVLVITPQLPEMGDESANEALRSRLIALFDQPSPRRVVVNLEFVNHVSRQTIALLLAHHFRLDRAGGALRICQAHARIIALLDQVRLTMLVDCFPTLDEAVLSAWTCAGGPSLPRG
jgi:anti-anti-sigma regulatory factor